jgi:hypothetical protein
MIEVVVDVALHLGGQGFCNFAGARFLSKVCGFGFELVRKIL